MADNTMGQRIAEERKRKGLSQEGLGEKVGVSRQAISKWESDGAVPEIDKLIALSRLFRVSVGWLLGVEELPEKKENELSEAQLKVVGELVKQTRSTPRSEWRTVIAMAVTVIALLISFVMAKQMHDTAVQTSASASQVSSLKSQLQDISTRLTELEASVHSFSTPSPVLDGYTIKVLPLVVTKDNVVRAKVNFTAVPSVWSSGDTGYLCVTGGSMDAFRMKCTWDGGHLNAAAILDVADGYELCFAVEHGDNSQEQQILEDETIENLAQEFAIPMHIERGSYIFKDGTLTFTDFTAYFDIPPIYQTMDEIPSITECEYRLYHWPHNSSEYALVCRDMLAHCSYNSTNQYLYQVTGQPVQFENVNIKNCRNLRLDFHVKFSNGMEQSYLITYLRPDGSGGITE